MSFAVGPAMYFHDTPRRPPKRSRSLEFRPEKHFILSRKQKSTSILSETYNLLERELDALENHVPPPRVSREIGYSSYNGLDAFEIHVPPSTPPINRSLEPSLVSRKMRSSKHNNTIMKIQNFRRGFSSSTIYGYLPLSPNSIRLICFKPNPPYLPTRVSFELIEVSLEDAPPYEALSYRWSIRATEKVICNGKVLFVSANCKKALKRLNGENNHLWVDAICINQQDDSEKNSQVALMSQIYSKAERIIAWLGEDKDLEASCLGDIDAALPYLILSSDTRNWRTKDAPLSSAMNKNSIITLFRDNELQPSRAFTNLLRRSWFSRMWIQQEVALAKDILIYCGSQSTTWSAFSSVLEELKRKSKLSKEFRAAWNLVTFRHQYRKNRENGGVDIHTAMVQARQCDATDMRDKIYALLGVCSELARFVGEPDYTLSVSVIWTRAQRAYLASSLSIGALSLVSFGEQSEEDIPSWVPDLSIGVRTWPRRPPPATPADGLARIIQCSGLDNSCLHVWGSYVDSVVVTYGPMDSTTLENMLECCRDWWTQFSNLPTKLNTSIGGKLTVFWSTLYCDVNEYVPRTINEESVLKGRQRFPPQFLNYEESEAFLRIRASDYMEVTFNKVFGVTSEGSIGLFPSRTQIGDLIVLFAGGTMPYLLRPNPKNPRASYSQKVAPCLRRSGLFYDLVGPCFVHGLTDVDKRAKHLLNPHEILLL